jgi:hypothetical protein
MQQFNLLKPAYADTVVLTSLRRSDLRLPLKSVNYASVRRRLNDSSVGVKHLRLWVLDFGPVRMVSES